MNDPELYEFVKTNQVQDHWRAGWKYNNNEFRLPYGRYFQEKTIIPKPLDSKCSDDEKQVVLTRKMMPIKKVRGYIIIILFLLSKYDRSN